MNASKRYPDKLKRKDPIGIKDIVACLESSLARLIELQNATGYPTALPQIEIEHVLRRLKPIKYKGDLSK